MYAPFNFLCVSFVCVHLNYQPGIALQELGELDEAASCYEKAIALSPDYVLAHYNLAYVRQDQVRSSTSMVQHSVTLGTVLGLFFSCVGPKE